MTPAQVQRLAIRPAYQLLPDRMQSVEATVMLLAIGLQESRFRYRIQLIGNHRHWWESLKGPARGMWQFERAGVRGVLRHPASRDAALMLLETLNYPPKVGVIHRAIAHNDVLAAGFARLLLWTDPHALPGLADSQVSWDYYLRTWRPGKPKRHTFDEFWQQATSEVLI